MTIERSILLGTEGKTTRLPPIWHDLPPAQAGLAAALRRAFDVPADEDDRNFEELLRKLR